MLETLFGITPKCTLRTHLIMILESAFNIFFNLKFFIFQVLKKLETFSIITVKYTRVCFFAVILISVLSLFNTLIFFKH